jgi:hypothetical protein
MLFFVGYNGFDSGVRSRFALMLASIRTSDLALRAIAAWCGSRGLAHLSTAHYVGGLNCRVRDGSGCVPAAMAASASDVVRYSVRT